MNAAAYNLPLDDLPDGWQPLEAIVLVKCLDADGMLRLCSRTTDGLTTWEALGILTAIADATSADLTANLNSD